MTKGILCPFISQSTSTVFYIFVGSVIVLKSDFGSGNFQRGWFGICFTITVVSNKN